MIKKCSKCKKTKDFKDFYKDRTKKYGYSYICKKCSNKKQNEYCKKPHVKEKRNKLMRDKRNQDDNYRKKINKQNNVYQRKTMDNPINRAKRTASSILCILRKTGQAPNWLSKKHIKDIEKLYVIAKLKSIKENISYEVDHIIPIKGKDIMGLHVLWNLRIITKEENKKKFNKIVDSL